MGEYRIFETREFRRRLEGLDPSVKGVLEGKLAALVYPQLRENPFFGRNIQKLRGFSPEVWRYRLGSYRLFYAVDEEEGTVYLLTLEHRRDAYR